MGDEEYERRAANRRANNALFAKWAREDRNQVIQELIEKADEESAHVTMNTQEGRNALHASLWLRDQIRGDA